MAEKKTSKPKVSVSKKAIKDLKPKARKVGDVKGGGYRLR